MDSKVWIFPEAMRPGGDPVWQSGPRGLELLAECSETIRLAPLGGIIEAASVGLPPETEVARGPLVVAAFGWEPPARSVHFELSLLSVDTHGMVGEAGIVSAREADILEKVFERLATARLTPKWGEQCTHGLVWEDGSLDLGCTVPAEVFGQPWEKHLPQGDGERLLGGLVDDSLNLLDGLEINRRRFDEGLPKLNLLWPHSFGFRPDVPNLPLRRGAPAEFWSADIGLQGMAKLTGYRHAPRAGFMRDGFVARDVGKAFAGSPGKAVLLDPSVGAAVTDGNAEQAAYALNDWDDVWGRLCKRVRMGDVGDGAILSPSPTGDGLGLLFGPSVKPNNIPFVERAFEDLRLRTLSAGEVVAGILGS